jgi:phosphatidylglycerol:prolipoprotein diacylglycerol transferase
MSFHGGLTGTTIAMIIFAKRNKIPIWSLFDIVAAVVPIGLFFGRIANFINGELWGRLADVPWAVVFPTGGPFARHPSQLYEAGLEGIVLAAGAGRSHLWHARAENAPASSPASSSAAMRCRASSSNSSASLTPSSAISSARLADHGHGALVPMILLGLWAIVRARRPGCAAALKTAGGAT